MATTGNTGSTTTIAPWQKGVAESGQAWNADLNNIAAHYGISLSALEAANPQISDPNSIAAGTSINIPQAQTGPGSSTSASSPGSSGATTSPTPAASGSAGTTSQIPASALAAAYDTSQAQDTLAQAGNVAGVNSGAAMYQQGQGYAQSAIQTFFGTGGGYAPQYLPRYQPGLYVQQVVAPQASSTQAAGSPGSTASSSS